MFFWIALIVVIALVYFPVVWVADKLAGNAGLNVAIVGMITAVVAFLVAIPVCFWIFLKYIVPTL